MMRKHLYVLYSSYLVLYMAFVSGLTDDIGFFWQLTDVHLDLDYKNHSCKGIYGDPKCDSPLALVHSAVNETKRFFATTPPDFVIWSGDNGPHIENFSKQRLQDHIQAVSQALRATFPQHVYILPTVGNHDVAPANLMSPDPSDTERLSWCHTLASNTNLWAPWLKPTDPFVTPTKDRPESAINSPPTANFSIGCFHSHWLPERKLILVSLNGLIWYTGNSLAGNAGPDPLGQLDWLNRTFAWARQTKHKVLIVCHFPPGASENSPHRFEHLRPEINDHFVHLLQQNADVTMAGLFAHEHVDSFRVLSDRKNRPALSLFLSPSISPMRLAGLGSFNPRIRLYRYQRPTGLLLGFTQYFLNLSQTDSHRWILEYDTNTTYELRDLSPTSLARLLAQFEQDEAPDGPWSRYWQHELGGQPHEPKPDLTSDGRCPRARSVCRCEHLCAMRNLALSPLHECLSGCPMKAYARDIGLTPKIRPVSANLSEINGTSGGTGVKQSSSLPIIVGVIIAFLAILVGVVLLVNREICRKRGRYNSPFSHPGNSVGGVIFSTLNDTLPRTFGGAINTVASRANGFSDSGKLTASQCDSTAGSCTELRVAFQPHYAIEDEFSVGKNGVADRDENCHYYVQDYHSRGSAARRTSQLLLTRLSHPIKSTRRTNGHLLAVSPNDIQLPSSSSCVDNRYSLPEFNRGPSSVSGRNQFVGSALQLDEQSSVLGGDSSVGALPSAVSNLSCPAEDYYADDEEAFGDDEDDGEESERLGEPTSPANHHSSVVETNEEPTSSTDSGPFDDGGQPFNLNSDKSIKPTKSIKDWSFITKRRSKRVGGGPLRSRRQSLEDPFSVTPIRRSNYSPVVHSQSITTGLSVLPQPPHDTHVDTAYNHTEHLHSLPSVNASDPAHQPLQVNGDLIEHPVSLVNGSSIRELSLDRTSHQTLGYDYVRM